MDRDFWLAERWSGKVRNVRPHILLQTEVRMLPVIDRLQFVFISILCRRMEAIMNLSTRIHRANLESIQVLLVVNPHQARPFPAEMYLLVTMARQLPLFLTAK